MSHENVCLWHSGVEKDLVGLKEKNIEQDQSILSSHKRIDGIKNWVIAGMASVILQFLVFIFGIVLILIKFK